MKREGKGGKFSIGANYVAELESWSLSEDPDSMDGVAMQDPNKTTRYGAVAISGELTFFDDDTDTNGQGAISPGGSASACSLYPVGDASGDEEIDFTNVQWGSVKRDSDASGWIKKTVSFVADSKTETTVV